MKKRKIIIEVEKEDPMTNVFRMPPPPDERKKPTDNQVALVIAVFISSIIGSGIFLFRQDLLLALFTGVVLYVLIFKYREIKEFFTKKMMRFFNTE